jgi:predicted transcriptional regulator
VDTKPVALTVKVNQETYVRLCTLGATRRRTNQDILRLALEEYLDRAGA